MEAADNELSQLRLTEYNIERRTKFVDLGRDDLSRVAVAKELVMARAGDHVAAFFDYLARFEETAALFSRPGLLEEAKRLKHDHLVAMVQEDYGKTYVEQRLRLATLYSDVGLDVCVFLGAYHYLLTAIGADIMAHFAADTAKAFKIFVSLRKIAFFDMGIIIDALLAQRERMIGLQQQAIRELSTPVLPLREGLLILPIIGVIDSGRARLLSHDLLLAIRLTRAGAIVMDITGVPAVDSGVANHLIRTIEAAKLMGAVVIVTGLSAAVAQTLVVLGVDLSALDTHGDLRSGVEKAERLLGYKVIRDGAAA